MPGQLGLWKLLLTVRTEDYVLRTTPATICFFYGSDGAVFLEPSIMMNLLALVP
jgi:hypothetical protein